MAIPNISNISNPITGSFGTGQVLMVPFTTTWIVPAGITNVRVRLWGGGQTGSNATGGSGGGFALKTIYGLTPGTSIVITVPARATTAGTSAAGGTVSFGSYVSATGGTSATVAGTGVGGDINFTGGVASAAANCGGGGVASLFGNGGQGSLGATDSGRNGASGGGAGNAVNTCGGSGALGIGALYVSTTLSYQSTTGLTGSYSIDLIGTGGGGAFTYPGVNGGGGGSGVGGAQGGFPGGGGAGVAQSLGAPGLVIVEY